MYLKITKETSETRSSLDEFDIYYFLDLYEGLSLQDYVAGLHNVDLSIKAHEAEKLRQLKPRL
jgi:peptidase E